MLYAGYRVRDLIQTMPPRSLLAVAVVAALMTSCRSVSGGDVVTCPVECRCGVVSGAPSADCSGRHVTDLRDVVDRLHPDTEVSLYVNYTIQTLQQMLHYESKGDSFSAHRGRSCYNLPA